MIFQQTFGARVAQWVR